MGYVSGMFAPGITQFWCATQRGGLGRVSGFQPEPPIGFGLLRVQVTLGSGFNEAGSG